MRWLLWSAAGWALGALLLARLISSVVRAVVAIAPGLNTMPLDLAPALAIFAVLGAVEFVVLRPHMPAAFTWVALNVLAGAVMIVLESPIRVLIFAPVEAAAGVAAGEAAVGGALGALYGAITAPQMVRIGTATRASDRRGGPRSAMTTS